jgi:trk system potassium uptake protein
MMTLLKLRKGQYALVEEQVHPRAQAVGNTLRDLPLPNECALRRSSAVVSS